MLLLLLLLLPILPLLVCGRCCRSRVDDLDVHVSCFRVSSSFCRVRELEGKVRELESSMARMGAQQDVNMELIGTFRHQKETVSALATMIAHHNSSSSSRCMFCFFCRPILRLTTPKATCEATNNTIASGFVRRSAWLVSGLSEQRRTGQAVREPRERSTTPASRL